MAKEKISVSKLENISDEEMKKRFSDHTYSVRRAPLALFLVDGKIYHFAKDDVRRKDPMTLLEGDWDFEEVENPKLKVNFYPLSKLQVNVINKKFFQSRDDFDKLSHESMFESFKFEKRRVERLGTVSFTDAMEKFDCAISCNMDYYLSHREEIKKDCKLDEFQPMSKISKFEKFLPQNYYLKQVEKGLFFKLLKDIFGDEEDEEEGKEQTVILRDFRLVLPEDEFKIGTAERGDYYIGFFYLYSW